MITIEDVADLLDEMMKTENEDFSKQVELIEDEILSNSSTMSVATQEEIASYITLDEISEDDIHQLLENMARMSNLSSEDEEIVMMMDRDFLKLMLIIEWLKRLDE